MSGPWHNVAFALVSTTAPAGCTTVMRDLTVSNLSLVERPAGHADSTETGERLRIELNTRTDLSTLSAKGVLLHVNARFCEHPNDVALRAWGVSESHSDADARRGSFARAATASLHTFQFLMSPSRRASPQSQPPQIGFDLTTNPEDVCFDLTGGYMWWSVSSNVIRVQCSDISKVFKSRRDASGEPSN